MLLASKEKTSYALPTVPSYPPPTSRDRGNVKIRYRFFNGAVVRKPGSCHVGILSAVFRFLIRFSRSGVRPGEFSFLFGRNSERGDSGIFPEFLSSRDRKITYLVLALVTQNHGQVDPVLVPNGFSLILFPFFIQ